VGVDALVLLFLLIAFVIYLYVKLINDPTYIAARRNRLSSHQDEYRHDPDFGDHMDSFCEDQANGAIWNETYGVHLTEEISLGTIPKD